MLSRKEAQMSEIKRTSKGQGSSSAPRRKVKKGKGKTKSKGKGQRTTWSWNHSQNWNQSDQKDHTGKNDNGKVGCQVHSKSGHQRYQCWWSQSSAPSSQTSTSQPSYQSQNSRQVYSVSEYPQANQFRLSDPIILRAFKTSDQLLNDNHKSKIIALLQVAMGQCLLFYITLAKRVDSVVTDSTSITSLQPFTSQTQTGEMCSAFPCPVSPSLPQRLQEPWAALIDTGALQPRDASDLILRSDLIG